MPRLEINNGGDWTPKPTGVLEAKIIDLTIHEPSDPELPNMKNLRNSANACVVRFTVLPDEHDKSHTIHQPILVAFKDGVVDLKNSRGIVQINKLCEALGKDVMGFAANGIFVDEDDEPQPDPNDMAVTLLNEIASNPDFRVLVHIYKQQGKDGKHYFRCGLNMHMLSEAQWAEKAAAADLEYEANRQQSVELKEEKEEEGSTDFPPKAAAPKIKSFSKGL